ncbi:SAM-dependent methyltransferase [bacterium]|nr:SAM-dependent methyltransferase [bacterium]
MLSPRLQAVADQVRGPRHADIGSDHASLPLYLSQRLERVIAVELHAGPLSRSRSACLGSRVEVRAGDGLAPLQADEVDSLSICGLGSLNIRDILQRGRPKLPTQLVLQPMDNAAPLRQWARSSGYHLAAEKWVRPFVVLEFLSAAGPDPAYQDLPEPAAEYYGPWLHRDPDYQVWLKEQQTWLRGQAALEVRLVWLESLLPPGI